jgi:prepilin-type N-terminal cleavage/methylation domain-containing protein
VRHGGGTTSRGGFSLMELLVVILVVAVVLGLGLPALSRVREASRVTVCSSNLRSIMQATHLYMQEQSRGSVPIARPSMIRLPETLDDRFVPERLREPPQVIAAYAGEVPTPGSAGRASVWLCPSDQTGAERLGLSYEYNLSSSFIKRGSNPWFKFSWYSPDAQARVLTQMIEQNVGGYGGISIWSDFNLFAHVRAATQGWSGERRVRYDTTVYWAPVAKEKAQDRFRYLLPFGTEWAN